MLNVKEAKEELAKKSYKDIQIETAFKWGSRAAASYENQIDAKSKEEKLMLWTLGEEYYHEAIEHAALVDDKAELLAILDRKLAPYKKKALKDIEKNLLGD